MAATIGAGQVRRFVREIDDGDILLVPHSSRKTVNVGRARGGFIHGADPSDGCPQSSAAGGVDPLADRADAVLTPSASLAKALRNYRAALG